MMEPSNEIFGAMSASRVLVSILKTVNSVKVHQDVFLEANNLDTELAVSYDWFERLSSGRSSNVTDIAVAEKVSNAYVIRVLHLAFLAPDIVERLRSGNYPTDLSCSKLTSMVPLPLNWAGQRKLLGTAD